MQLIIRRARHGVGAWSLSLKTSIVRAMPYRLPTVATNHKTQKTGQKNNSQRYSQRHVTIVMVPTRQFRHNMTAARPMIRTSRAMRTMAVRRLPGTEIGKANVMTPR